MLNAADYYGLEELRRSCIGFVTCCITVDTVNSILASAERYIQYKCTKSLVQRESRVAVLRRLNFIISNSNFQVFSNLLINMVTKFSHWAHLPSFLSTLFDSSFHVKS